MDLNEKEIKARIIGHLLSAGTIRRGSLIANEFVIPGSSVRADLAILSDKFIGIEIKSGRDSLKRLSTQVAGYQPCFHKTILVLADKHLKSFPIEEYQGVEVLHIDNAGTITTFLPAKINDIIQSMFLLKMLTQAERRRHLKESHKKSESLSGEMVVTKDIVWQAFKAAFSARFETTSNEFWMQIKRRKIRSPDLELLSRFREKREALKRWHYEREQQSLAWSEKLRELKNLYPEIA